MSANSRTFLLVIGVALSSACAPGREQSRADSAYDNRDQFAEPGDVRIGNRGAAAGGGGFSVSVGADFGRPQAEEVLHRLVALDSAGEFAQFTCGEEPPHFGFDITLHRESEVQERIVTLAYTGYVKPSIESQCLSRGFDYLVARTFAEVDSGPSVDYGYTNPSTGEKYPPMAIGDRHARRWPTCHCEMSHDVREWVTNGPKETSTGANAR